MQLIKTPREYADLIAGSKPVLIDFYADWCGPCKMLAPHFEKAAAAYAQKVVFAKVDVDAPEMREVVEKHAIDTIPTVIGFSGGEPKVSRVGFMSPAQLNQMADSLAG